jgi:hypothetical protein
MRLSIIKRGEEVEKCSSLQSFTDIWTFWHGFLYRTFSLYDAVVYFFCKCNCRWGTG